MNIKYLSIAVIVIAAVAVTSLFIAYTVDSEWLTPWPDEVVDGMWAEEIIITYADGTEQSLKPLMFNRPWPLPASVTYEGQEIIDVDYFLYAQATGTEYTTCYIDGSDFCITTDVSIGTTAVLVNVDCEHGSFPIALNEPKTPVYFSLNDIDSILDGEPSGEYTITFNPGGTIRYRGENGAASEWFTATLPSSCTVVVDNSAGTVQLDLTATEPYFSYRYA